MKNNDTSDKQKKQLKDKKRHKRVYRFAQIFVAPFFTRKFRFRHDKTPEIDGNFLLLSNHNTDYDFIFVGSSFRPHMYFVASEHVYQKGTLSKLLKRYFAPIARLKGVNAASTVMTIMRSLRSGDNVCIFAEGNRSYNGETCPILFSTGKLARSSGASLVTYRLEGGYLSTPRWSYTLRKGKMRGHVVNVYSPEQLKSMTDDEINAAINADLYENAYERQSEWKTAYRGKRLAEGIEHILFLCPKCGRMSSLSATGSHIQCECGLDAVYDKYGYIQNAPYHTVLDWDRWQQKCLHEIVSTSDHETELFSDDGVRLLRIGDDHKPTVEAEGTLSMTGKALCVAGKTFPISEIEGLAIYSRCAMVLTHGGIHYEIKTDRKLCAVKYLRAFEQLKEAAE